MSRGYLAKCSNRFGKPKKTYESEAEAEKVRESAIKAGHFTRNRSNVYWCNQHLGWHVGAMTKPRQGRKTGRGGFEATQ